MEYKIVSADSAIGQILVKYTDGGIDVGTFAIDVPIVDGVYITGAALDAEILSHAPVWVAQRKSATAAASGFSEIAAMASAEATAVPTLAERKVARIAAINSYRERVMAAGVVFDGNQFDSDDVSVTRLTAVVSTINAGATLPAGFVWRSSINIDVPMNAAQLVGLLATMILTANSIYQTSWAKKQAIEAATTDAELDAVVWIDPAVGVPA